VRLCLSDGGCAAFLGAVLLPIVAYAVFGFQHGFEEQVGWYVTLLPGAIVAVAISDFIKKTVPGVESFAFLGGARLPKFSLVLWHQPGRDQDLSFHL